MGKKGSTTRTTISVPLGLKKRMDKVKEPINWSGQACHAFESKLNEIDQQEKGTKEMSSVVERLRASKLETENEELNTGVDAGEEWAKSTASYAELHRIGELDERSSPIDWEQLFITCDNDAYGADQRFVFTVQPENDRDRGAAKDFWEGVVGEGVEQTDDFVRGFADGAVNVWYEVKDKL